MDIAKDPYRKVLEALKAGPKSSEEILSECAFSDTFHCSSALSILVRQGLIAKGYRLTEAGQRAITGREPSDSNQNSGAVTHGPVPPIPKPSSPGFEWIFDETKWEWVQRRKREFDSIRPPGEQPPGQEIDLFG